jgi:hypothetical protein
MLPMPPACPRAAVAGHGPSGFATGTFVTQAGQENQKILPNERTVVSPPWPAKCAPDPARAFPPLSLVEELTAGAALATPVDRGRRVVPVAFADFGIKGPRGYGLFISSAHGPWKPSR